MYWRVEQYLRNQSSYVLSLRQMVLIRTSGKTMVPERRILTSRMSG
jgi:hypothetical protein